MKACMIQAQESKVQLQIGQQDPDRNPIQGCLVLAFNSKVWHLFANPKEAKRLRWDHDERTADMSTKHSTWPVLLCIHNLAPRLFMKKKYIMMSMIIQGPKQPGNDIDIYFQLLVEELLTVWIVCLL